MKVSSVAIVAACFCLGLTVPALAAEAPVANTANQASPAEDNVSAVKPAEACLGDLRDLQSQLEKDGYWLGGSSFGLGYPMDGYSMDGTAGPGYQNVRPGYEVRTLVASASILARHGQQQPCEDVLAATRDLYKLYLVDMHNGRVPMMDAPGWRRRQIAAATPVTSSNSSLRSDELLGVEVRDQKNEALGSVNDLVMSPKTGKIAYLVIGRGGIFGFDKKYVPVPWEDFRTAPNFALLVLDAPKGAMDAAPQVDSDQFATAGHFDEQSQKIDSYWKAHLSIKASN